MAVDKGPCRLGFKRVILGVSRDQRLVKLSFKYCKWADVTCVKSKSEQNTMRT